MTRKISLALLFAFAAVSATLWPSKAEAQWRHSRAVFVGGFYSPFYYDPFFYGPGWYPYPYGYYPYWRPEADIRVLATPKQAEVYVDGYYAGKVDDFNGFFQRLHVPPGDHEVTLHLDGYRTVTQKLYLARDSTYKLRYTMEKLGPGETSEPPPQAPQAPQGQAGRMRQPRFVGPPQAAPPGGAPAPPQPPTSPEEASSFGALVIRAQPADVQILIDGEPWSGPQGDGRLVVQLSEGSHHVEIQKDGYRRYSTDIQVRRGQTTPVNVSLSPER